MPDGPYSAHQNGTSTVLNAPTDARGTRYVRDKVPGSVGGEVKEIITFTPISHVTTGLSQIATVVVARVAGDVVVLSVWPEYKGKLFNREVDKFGTIKYMEVKQ